MTRSPAQSFLSPPTDFGRIWAMTSHSAFCDAFVSRRTMRRSSAGSSGSGSPDCSPPNEAPSSSSENTGSNPVRAFASELIPESYAEVLGIGSVTEP